MLDKPKRVKKSKAAPAPVTESNDKEKTCLNIYDPFLWASLWIRLVK